MILRCTWLSDDEFFGQNEREGLGTMERKRKMSIMVRLLLMVIPPCLLMGVLMTLYSG